MSAKPATLPRFATAGGAVVVTPAAGKLDVGWVTAERPPAQFLNWLHYWNYKWAEYLNDGAMSGAFTFDNTVAVTGLITATAGLTCAVNQHVTVSGTGKYKRPQFTTPIHAVDSQRSGGGAVGNLTSIGGWAFGSAGETLVFNIPCQEGERIHAISAIMADNGADTCRMLCHKQAWVVGAGVTQTQLGAQQNTVGSTGTVELLTVSGLTEDVPANGLTNYTATIECLTLVSGLSCKGLIVTKSVP